MKIILFTLLEAGAAFFLFKDSISAWKDGYLGLSSLGFLFALILCFEVLMHVLGVFFKEEEEE